MSASSTPTQPTVTLPIPPAWVAHADRLILEVVTANGGAVDIIRFRVVGGVPVLEYPLATVVQEGITA